MSSQEQRPIRSRRELRRAREEQSGAAAQPDATAHPDATAQPDAQPEATAEPTAQPKPAAEPKVPAKAGVDSKAPTTSAAAGADRPAGSDRPAARNRRAADGPVDAVGTAAQERSSQVRARDRAALRTIKELADKEEQLSGGGPPTRRQLRLQQLQAEVATSMNPIVPVPGSAQEAAKPGAPTDDAGNADATKSATTKPGMAKPEVATAGDVNETPAEKNTPKDKAPDAATESGMSVEQALAVRELIAAQVQNQTSKLEHIAEQDPLAVDPAVLAEQIALAERAAVLNKRAAAKQKLAEQNKAEQGKVEQAKSPAATSGPSTANNLAMVTPLEFVKVPGVERPVMKRPSTTFVPLITSAGPTLDDPSQVKKPGSRGRAGVLARAEAVARSARKKPAAPVERSEETQRPPVSASTAYGLDPLDVNTAGLARAQRNRLLQYGVLAMGLVALIVGIIMITSG
ncbi:hypothetical protein QEH68_12085 [Paenarthrobacter sp. OM7]|uniref:hypothetical protein n=1 Tax=Paenarthrobacter sp. OM7 TaxID=3041264 RepID=UPI0024696168|nr:hypothetical protein [Paenarthrobacter sp. OM7]WGM18794.1 hypothetical protein QEH68_12085 [Paenarthrobacter sp. OM7]